MGVLYPLIAWAGLGLVSVPIVLHLIMRQKPKLLEFPALRFVRRQHETNQRRLRLRHLLLLLLRAMAILLLALALARPSIRPSARLSGVLGQQEAPVAAALVFDTAPRMQYRQDNQTRIEAAQQLGLWLLGQLPRESEVAVVDTRPGSGGAFEIDMLAAEKRIERLETVADSQPLSRALDEALRRLDQSELGRKEVYVFTDLARAAWPAGSAGPIEERLASMPDARICLIDVGVEEPKDWALGELRLSGQVFSNRGSLRIRTELSQVGMPGERAVELFVLDNEGRQQKRSEQNVAVGAGESREVEFRLGSLDVGTHQGLMRIVGQDGLAADDARFFTVEVRPASRILVAAPEPADRNALFLSEALAPAILRRQGQSRFLCDVVSLEDLAEQATLDHAAVCLLDPTPLKPDLWKQLDEYVDAGHGLAVFLGRNARPVDSFNAPDAQRLLPGKLLRQARAPAGDLHLAPRDYQHPILSAFRGVAGAIPWDASPVFRYWELDRPPKGAGVVLTYSNGEPAILERPVGNGRVLTMTTPVSDDPNHDPWNLLPVSLQADQAWPFVILVNQMASYLVGSTDQQLNYVAGQTAVLKLDARDEFEIYHVFAPDDLTFPVSADRKQGLLMVTATDRVGNYRVRAGGLASGVDRGFSVNLTPEQTQLDRLDDEALAEILGPIDYRVARTTAQIERDINTARVGRELFPALILLVVIVLAAEHLLANRFYRR